MNRMVLAAIATTFLATSAFADQCSEDMSEIDAMKTVAKLNDANLKTLEDARLKAAELQKAGKVEECSKVLSEARKVFGYKEDQL